MSCTGTRRGFSLIEVMITALVLGIAILGLTSTYTTSSTGMSASRSRMSAHELAKQRLELLATQVVDELPGCSGAPSCQSEGAYTNPLPASRTFQCTQYVDDMETIDPGLATSQGRYRVDTLVESHPDALRQPNARLVTVSVCWTDSTGKVHETQSRRTFIPGV